jgi:hypothetical protein
MIFLNSWSVFRRNFNKWSHIPGSAIFPPSPPVKPIIFMPIFFAVLIADRIFLELPEVDIPQKTSPLRAFASSWREKTTEKS